MAEETAGTKGIGGKVLKWIGVATAVISFVLGVRQVVILVQDHAARKKEAAGLSIEAKRLSSSGEYSQAWQVAGKAAELSPEYRNVQIDMAMEWLRNARLPSNGGERTFAEITQKLLPVLFRAIDTTRKDYSATIMAHIGWANYLMFKEGDWGVRVDDQFKNALQMDSTNSYAQAMYGFWMLYPGHDGGSIDEANRHFAAALRGGKDTAFVRYLRLCAYQNAAGPEYQAQIINLANEMRKNHESMARDERKKILDGAYFMYRDEIMKEVGKVLSPEDHLATFMYLADGVDVEANRYYKAALTNLQTAVHR